MKCSERLKQIAGTFSAELLAHQEGDLVIERAEAWQLVEAMQVLAMRVQLLEADTKVVRLPGRAVALQVTGTVS